MEDTVFWKLLEGACEMGKFIVAVPNSAASANLVGKVELGRDGGERVLQKRNQPNYHVHFKPELITEFAFVHLDVGHGPEPCLEIRALDGQPIVRLYYKGRRAASRCEKFVQKNSQHEAFISGSWPRLEENAGGETLPSGIFVSGVVSNDGDDALAS